VILKAVTVMACAPAVSRKGCLTQTAYVTRAQLSTGKVFRLRYARRAVVFAFCGQVSSWSCKRFGTAHPLLFDLLKTARWALRLLFFLAYLAAAYWSTAGALEAAFLGGACGFSGAATDSEISPADIVFSPLFSLSQHTLIGTIGVTNSDSDERFTASTSILCTGRAAPS
jgi:hypothetical protein